VIDINCAKTYKLRGQAWVVFDTVTAATAAVKQMNEFPFYDKPMRVSYARATSDATAKAEGTFDPAARDPAVRQKRKAESQAREKQSQVAKKANGRESGAGAESAAGAEATTPPNAILFVQGLPGTSLMIFLSIFLSIFRNGRNALRRHASSRRHARDVRVCRPMITSTQPIKLSDARG
jgi:U2 small nuclear ribonucleoprotein B''